MCLSVCPVCVCVRIAKYIVIYVALLMPDGEAHIHVLFIFQFFLRHRRRTQTENELNKFVYISQNEMAQYGIPPPMHIARAMLYAEYGWVYAGIEFEKIK